MPSSSLTIDRRLAGPELETVRGIVNRAYETGEAGLWRAGAYRIDLAGVREIAALGELAVARAGDGAILGCVRTRPGYLGLLSVDPGAQGSGAGRALVAFAEADSVARGARRMRLQLLVPRTGEHSFKVRLHAWYSRLGYVVVARQACELALPEPAAWLAVPCDLLDYEKDLG